MQLLKQASAYCKFLPVIYLLTPASVFAQDNYWSIPAEYQQTQNPVPVNENSIAAGKQLYVIQCTPCHGEKGEGNGELAADLVPAPADHSSLAFQQQPDGEIFYKIAMGRNAMPAWRSSLSEQQIWALVNFIRTLKQENKKATPVKDTVQQTTKNIPGRRKFLFSGSAHMNIASNAEHADNIDWSMGFMPLFLWKPNDRLYFEAHLHMEAATQKVNEGGGHSHSGPSSATAIKSINTTADVMLDYANLVYFVNPYMAITGGLFLSPFGIYSERLHPEWINKLPDAPLGMGHDDPVGPGTELGLQLRGPIPLGKMKANYAVYVSNGPALIDTGKNAGKLIYSNLSENNANKAIGGRIGLLPLYNSSVEIGFSMQTAQAGAEGTNYEDVRTRFSAADISYYHVIKPLRGSINIKGQYNAIQVDEAYYKTDSMTLMEIPASLVNKDSLSYRFENKSTAYFLMLSYRPLLSKKKWLKDMEWVVRYDALDLPGYSSWEKYDRRLAIGMVYWMEARSGLKIAYEMGQENYLMMIQLVIGL